MTVHVAGAGGFGREVLDALLALGTPVPAFLDDSRAGEVVRGVPVLHPDQAPAGARVVVAVADPAARQALAERLAGAGASFATVIHPRATVAPETTVGEGSVVLANAYVSSSVRLGRHAQVDYNATIGHDAVLGDYATVLPGANVGGGATVGAGAVIGSNAAVRQGITIGARAVVGAGAVVVADVPEGVVAKGVPARW